MCRFSRYIFAIFLLGWSLSAMAWTTIDVLSAISCNSSLERDYYREQLTAYYGPVLERKGGALWFKGKDSIYGATIREIFVSAGPPMLFVGVVLEASPVQIAEEIGKARFASARMYFDAKNNRWAGSDGREMVWHEGKYAKIFCIGMRDGR